MISGNKEFNLKAFLAGEGYQRVKAELSAEINHVDHKQNTVNRKYFVKSAVEKKLGKELRTAYKNNPNLGREDLIKDLVNSPIPNWGSVKFHSAIK